MFSKILIANRGEIAVKIIEVCHSLGIKTVAVYSEADKNSLHTKLADESYCIGASPAKESYLNMKAIVSIAVACGAQAIHPGYGFLSENYEFAALCQENDICFIGPPPEILKNMGDKIIAKETMKNLGVPVIPGEFAENDISKIKSIAKKIGYPIIIKLRCGGGGKGIKIVHAEEDLEKAIIFAVDEGKNFFNSNKIYIEKYLTEVSHVEVQMLADKQGNVLCLGERDCSVQVNNQKIIEETPCAKINNIKRQELFSMCINAIQKTGYVGAGTLEFLMDSTGSFYFMEMNCRLQVEYAITEMVTNLNLIKLQILIAAGNPLPITQPQIKFSGFAIECRINFQNANFENIIKKLIIPKTESTRFDTFLYEGYNVPVFYDSLLGKLIVHGNTRKLAFKKMLSALNQLEIDGIGTNIETHKQILNNETFKNHSHNTNFMNLFKPYNKKYISARERVALLTDKNSFIEYDKDMISHDIIDFERYSEKLNHAMNSTSENEAVIYGTAKILGVDVVFFAMDGNFMMGSMGRVVGEKVTKAFELAIDKQLPVIGVCISGGARMQEGIFSLLQMAKTAAIVKKHSDCGLLYISIITNPTLGGVSASFASLSDIIIAESGSVFGFSGRRIIEETLNKKLPDTFQTAEYAQKHGMVDIVADKNELKGIISKILKIHERRFYGKDS
ncbi:MAG: Acetyl-CoA carboxylase, biotin carboxylase subunit [Eubacteriales bacterium SKADARSKE-1]|nr:Acetyl-CoA carboxylase, biotin carboxylase subunit [Eubacteriales bacterium SKADARSKE-1]